MKRKWDIICCTPRSKDGFHTWPATYFESDGTVLNYIRREHSYQESKLLLSESLSNSVNASFSPFPPLVIFSRNKHNKQNVCVYIVKRTLSYILSYTLPLPKLLYHILPLSHLRPAFYHKTLEQHYTTISFYINSSVFCFIIMFTINTLYVNCCETIYK